MIITAFAASNSSQSINRKLVSYAARLIQTTEVNLLDLHDYEMPLYSQDREQACGVPDQAHRFLQQIAESDALIISFAEHNGSYSAAYKNLFDWCSRVDQKVYQDKPMVLLSTSPGPRGGTTVLSAAVNAMPYFGGVVKGQFSLPSFHENFDVEKGRVKNESLDAQLKGEVAKLTDDM